MILCQTNTVLFQGTMFLFQRTEPLFRRTAARFAPVGPRRRIKARQFPKTLREVLESNVNCPSTSNQMVIVMATSVKTVNRSLVTLNLPKSAPALIAFAESIVKRMTGNAWFSSPAPSLAAVTAAIDDLRAAEATAISRVKGAAAARNEKRKALVAVLQQLRSYIQSVADADEGNGPAIIESAGLAVHKRATRTPRVFAAKPGRTPGVATVVAAAAGHRGAYEWQYSIDGGKTWVATPATLQARTTVAGLTPGATVQFRYRTVTRAGEGDWSAPVSLTVQ
jgi:hypothetical protein